MFDVSSRHNPIKTTCSEFSSRKVKFFSNIVKDEGFSSQSITTSARKYHKRYTFGQENTFVVPLHLTVLFLTFCLQEFEIMTTNHSILVVDDEDGLRTLIASELTRIGYKVETATDGDIAIAHLRRAPFDVAILDIKMPKVDGIEVLKFINSNCPATKAIMLTGFADLSYAMECKRYGAVDFIGKPFSFQDLLSTIEVTLKEETK